MTHPADSGASLIRAIIGEPNPALGSAEDTVATGFAAASGLEAQVPTSTMRGLEKMRGIYTDMARRIEGVHTIDGDVKGRALAGVKGMVAGLALFEAGVQGGTSKRAQKQLGEAAAKLERASRDLEAALS